MRSTRWVRSMSLAAALTLILAACAAEETTTTAEDTTSTTASGGATPEPGASIDGTLTIGTLLPVTGDLAFLGPPEIAGARLAVADINAAGGVLGNDVVLVEGNSGDTNEDIANPETDRLLAQGADAIVGAASSAVSKLVIDKITGAGIIQFSPANTSPDFTTYNDGGLFFRTAPSDLLQGKVLADQVIAQGNETAAVIYRQESYGQGLADAFQAAFEAAGGTVSEFIGYAVDTENFDADVDKIVAADPDAIIVIGFSESANILTTMNERGVGPAAKNVWGVDGNIGGIGAELADPTILTGMRGTEPGVDIASDFKARLDGSYEGGLDDVYAYGAETYDATVIIALAAEIAGTDDPVAIAAEINGVTKDGTTCTTFTECKDLIAAGEDIDYDGIGGPYSFVDAGEPAAASYRIATYDGGATPNTDLDEFVFAE